MRYGYVDKKTGISLDKDVYAEHFAEPDDIKTNYMIKLYGDVILEGEDSKALSRDIMNVIERLHMVADFLRRVGASRGTVNEPSGDK
jgi:hypothetical protein